MMDQYKVILCTLGTVTNPKYHYFRQVPVYWCHCLWAVTRMDNFRLDSLCLLHNAILLVANHLCEFIGQICEKSGEISRFPISTRILTSGGNTATGR